MKLKGISCLILGAIILLCTCPLFAAVPQMINYQGRLTTSVGSPVNDTANLVFIICTDSLCTTQLWSESRSNVIIKDGLFDAILGSITPIPSVVFDGSVRFLSVSLDGTPITRRLQIASVGYAFRTLNADTAAYAKASAGDIDCADCSDDFVNVKGPDSVTVKSGTALLARSSGTSSGAHVGFVSYGSNAGTGTAYGGSFVVTGDGTGTHYGVRAEADGSASATTYGVWSQATNTAAGPVYGGLFRASSSGTGVHYALKGLSYGTSDNQTYGSYNYAQNTSTGDVLGGYFEAGEHGTGTHYAVQAKSYASSSGIAYGVHSEVDNTGTGAAYGGYFGVTSSGSGTHTALQTNAVGGTSGSTYAAHHSARTTSSSLVAAVYGSASSTASGGVYGGLFQAPLGGTGMHMGVSGDAATCSGSNPSCGVYGTAVNACGGDAYGGYFYVPGRDDGNDYAVYAVAPHDTLGDPAWAGVFVGKVVVEGNFTVVGLKSAAVETAENEYRAVYCQESPENWFEDFGGGKLVNGHTHIELDPVFLQTVTIDAQHPMRVFVQLEGDCNGVYIEKGLTGFDVSELKSGSSNVSFSYRVVAKRKGYEDLRLAKLEGFNPEETRAKNAKIQAEFESSRAKMQAEAEAMEENKPTGKKAATRDDQNQE